ncbi:MAG: AbrB/MazE/SpoVT family DNA-binding domain-containing protein [Candidatus Bathyarchaeia archaeon]
MSYSKITKKGQTTVPVQFRRKYNLREGSLVIFEETENGLVIKPAPYIADSGLEIVNLTAHVAKQARIFRHKCQKKISWGDYIIAATAFLEKVDIMLTENPHLGQLREVKARTLAEVDV